MRPRLGHRVEGVGRGEQPRRHAELRTRSPAVIAGPVEALVVGPCDRRERREKRRAREHALGVVRVQAHLLPFVWRKRSRLLPDARVHRHATEVMDEPGPPDRSPTYRVDLAGACSHAGELRDAGGVAGEVGRDEVGEVPHRGERAVEGFRLQYERRRLLQREDLVPRRGALIEREKLRSVVEEASGDVRIEGVTSTLA
jgi:hypothetical protein